MVILVLIVLFNRTFSKQSESISLESTLSWSSERSIVSKTDTSGPPESGYSYRNKNRLNAVNCENPKIVFSENTGWKWSPLPDLITQESEILWGI